MATEIISKRCPKCKQKKTLSEFYKNRSEKDGLQGWCKSCFNAKVKAYQQTEKGKAVKRKGDAKYKKTPKGRATEARYRQTPYRKATLERYYARHPNHHKARTTVNHAIRDGRLPKPDSMKCHYCPAQAKEYHHWHGYDPEHWLDVVPACLDCHTKEDRKIA